MEKAIDAKYAAIKDRYSKSNETEAPAQVK